MHYIVVDTSEAFLNGVVDTGEVMLSSVIVTDSNINRN
jgi:hypothetical protein